MYLLERRSILRSFILCNNHIIKFLNHFLMIRYTIYPFIIFKEGIFELGDQLHQYLNSVEFLLRNSLFLKENRINEE